MELTIVVNEFPGMAQALEENEQSIGKGTIYRQMGVGFDEGISSQREWHDYE